MKCPACPHDISEFLQNPQVNREVMDIIEKLKQRLEDENTVKESTVKASDDTSEKGLEALSTDEDTDSSKAQTEVSTDSEGTEALFQDAEYGTSTEIKPKKRQKKTDAGGKISETRVIKSSGIMSSPSKRESRCCGWGVKSRGGPKAMSLAHVAADKQI